jgi:hypothetical protein
MLILRYLRSAFGCAGRCLGEACCAAGERIVERLEQVADAIAEGRYRAAQMRNVHGLKQQVIAVKKVDGLNGHRHLD